MEGMDDKCLLSKTGGNRLVPGWLVVEKDEGGWQCVKTAHIRDLIIFNKHKIISKTKCSLS